MSTGPDGRRCAPTMPPRRSGLAFSSMLLASTCALMARPGQATPLDVYGRLPSLEEVSLSPDGSRIALVRTTEDLRVIQVVSLDDRRVLGTLRVGERKLRGLRWADDTHLMVVTSATDVPRGLIGTKREWAMLQVYDVARHKVTAVPHRPTSGSLAVLNVISGDMMVRRVDGHTVLFLEGLCLYGAVLPALFRVDLDSGFESVIRRGSAGTRRWLVDAAGEVMAEQKYDQKRQVWALLVRRGERFEELASGHAAVDVPQLVGFGPSGGALLIQLYEDGSPVWKLASLSDGRLGPPMAEQGSLETPIEDPLSHRVIGGLGVGADGDEHYVFFDPEMRARWDAVLKTFEGARVGLASASRDFRKFVVRVEAPSRGLRYWLVSVDGSEVVLLGDVYAGVTEPLEVRHVVYPAADGLPIPAYLTLPRGRAPQKLPLVVLPHGGPAARDTADFDWWSQALADQGYAVLRPNYRGSALPTRFLAAGFGEWGRKMQSDLSDGVRYLAREGIADPARVCIAGGSYGGYAALAGVTLDPGVYRCAISIAGMSDLKRMLRWVRNNHAHATELYWDRFMGLTGPGDPALVQISPIDHIDAVRVPVLLIHGRDDTVVPFEQSEVMFDALRNAKKAVELVPLKHEDHWLSRGETRLQMLQTSVAFLRAHNPPD
jgi:cephalosporin-C deacetylase-like acetyl esterase